MNLLQGTFIFYSGLLNLLIILIIFISLKLNRYGKLTKEQGVTKYLYENEEYLNDIREGKIICEGINVEEIKNMLFG